jgi:hypothetical protein
LYNTNGLSIVRGVRESGLIGPEVQTNPALRTAIGIVPPHFIRVLYHWYSYHLALYMSPLPHSRSLSCYLNVVNRKNRIGLIDHVIPVAPSWPLRRLVGSAEQDFSQALVNVLVSPTDSGVLSLRSGSGNLALCGVGELE